MRHSRIRGTLVCGSQNKELGLRHTFVGFIAIEYFFVYVHTPSLLFYHLGGTIRQICSRCHRRYTGMID